MPRPRVSRTVTGHPAAVEHSSERPDPSGRAPGDGVPRRRIERNQVDVRTKPAGDQQQLDGLVGAVVHAVDHGPLERGTAMRAIAPVGDRLLELGEGMQPVRRDQRGAELVVGRVQADGKPDLRMRGREMADAGHEPDGRDRDVAGTQPGAGGVGQPLDRAEGSSFVRHRLAHPHEDDVGEPPRGRLRQAPGLSPSPPDLRGDLARRQVPVQTHLAGGAERAPHRASRLGRHANRHAVGVAHDDGFDDAARIQAQERLARSPGVGDALLEHLDAQRQLLGQPGAKRWRHVGHLVVVGRAAPQLSVDLLGAKRGLAPGRHPFGEGLDAQVQGTHDPEGIGHPYQGSGILRARGSRYHDGETASKPPGGAR